jgi:hypothetical protein
VLRATISELAQDNQAPWTRATWLCATPEPLTPTHQLPSGDQHPAIFRGKNWCAPKLAIPQHTIFFFVFPDADACYGLRLRTI